MSNAIIAAYKEEINQLTRRRDEVHQRLQAVTKTADEIRATIQSMDALLLSLQDFVHREAGESQKLAVQTVPENRIDSVPVPKKRTTGNSKKEDVARAARLLIERSGQPVTRADLYPLLIEQGFRIEGSNPEMVLSTMLWRAGEKAGIVRLKSGGYWLAEKPWPGARYNPQRVAAIKDLIGD